MRQRVALVAVGLAVAAGCGSVATVERGVPLGTVLALPAGQEPSGLLAGAADTAYRYQVAVAHGSSDVEHMPIYGSLSTPSSASVLGIGFLCHFLAPVQNDDAPIALQPVDQRASMAWIDLGFGDIDEWRSVKRLGQTAQVGLSR